MVGGAVCDKMSDRINATTLQAVFSSGTHRAASSVNATIRSPRVVSTLTLLFIPFSPFLKIIGLHFRFELEDLSQNQKFMLMTNEVTYHLIRNGHTNHKEFSTY
jgi:hypothetical protein